MGLVYSYFAADHEKRIQSLEKIVVELNKRTEKAQADVREMKEYLEEQKMMFQWSGTTVLYDPKKVIDIQMDNAFTNELDEEMKGFEDAEAFMKHKGFTTQEELDAYIESKRRYTFNVHYGTLYHTRTFDNKAEADDFRERFSKWQGMRF